MATLIKKHILAFITTLLLLAPSARAEFDLVTYFKQLADGSLSENSQLVQEMRPGIFEKVKNLTAAERSKIRDIVQGKINDNISELSARAVKALNEVPVDLEPELLIALLQQASLDLKGGRSILSFFTPPGSLHFDSPTVAYFSKLLKGEVPREFENLPGRLQVLAWARNKGLLDAYCAEYILSSPPRAVGSLDPMLAWEQHYEALFERKHVDVALIQRAAQFPKAPQYLEALYDRALKPGGKPDLVEDVAKALGNRVYAKRSNEVMPLIKRMLADEIQTIWLVRYGFSQSEWAWSSEVNKLIKLSLLRDPKGISAELIKHVLVKPAWAQSERGAELMVSMVLNHSAAEEALQNLLAKDLWAQNERMLKFVGFYNNGIQRQVSVASIRDAYSRGARIPSPENKAFMEECNWALYPFAFLNRLFKSM